MADDQKDVLSKLIVDSLKAGKRVESTYAFAQANSVDHLVVVGIVKSLDAKEVAKITQKEITEVTLTEFGKETLAKGSPEARLWTALGDKKVAQNDCAALISVDAEVGKAAVATGLKLGWLAIEKGAAPLVHRKAASIQDVTKEQIEGIVSGKISDKKLVDPIKKRGFLDLKCVNKENLPKVRLLKG